MGGLFGKRSDAAHDQQHNANAPMDNNNTVDVVPVNNDAEAATGKRNRKRNLGSTAT